ncbi:hypothetical protein GOBAR_DD25644 [Gossypium barbadense]|nr:hypothetical protein GOBAR_DD25644 [Gossypium barbadense]
MGLKQVDQMNVGFVHIEHVRKAMAINRQKVRTMNVQLYYRHYETFRVTKTIDFRPSILPRSYGVDLLNRRCDCGEFQTLHYLCVHVIAAYAEHSINVGQYIDEGKGSALNIVACANQRVIIETNARIEGLFMGCIVVVVFFHVAGAPEGQCMSHSKLRYHL